MNISFHIRYLIGGLGNQCLQICSMPLGADYSNLLLHPIVRRLCRYPVHHKSYSAKKVTCREIFGIFLVSIDLVLAKTVGLSLFTVFQLKNLSTKPMLAGLYSLGYFQEMTNSDDQVKELIDEFLESCGNSYPEHSDIDNAVIIHLRGGDYLRFPANSQIGVLDFKYFQKCLTQIPEKFKTSPILIVSDDAVYATKCITWLRDRGFDCSISPARDVFTDISLFRHCGCFIASNSTFSLIAGLSRERIWFAPSPFYLDAFFDDRYTRLAVVQDAIFLKNSSMNLCSRKRG